MTAAWLLARAEWRARWPSVAVIALLAALAGPLWAQAGGGAVKVLVLGSAAHAGLGSQAAVEAAIQSLAAEASWGPSALEGAFATGGQDGVRNVELALKQVKNTVAGKKIETVVAPTDTKPDTTVRMARKLIEQDKVDFIIGPLSGSEGIAMRDFAKTIPDKKQLEYESRFADDGRQLLGLMDEFERTLTGDTDAAVAQETS